MQVSNVRLLELQFVDDEIGVFINLLKKALDSSSKISFVKDLAENEIKLVKEVLTSSGIDLEEDSNK